MSSGRLPELQYRIPNPSPRGVDGDAVLCWLAAHADEHVVIIVGETASHAVRAALLRRNAGARVIYLKVLQRDVGGALERQIAVGVARALGAEVHGTERPGTVAELVEVGLGLTERDAWTVLLDGVDVECSGVCQVMTLLSRFARASRWIVVSRTPPRSAPPVSALLHLRSPAIFAAAVHAGETCEELAAALARLTVCEGPVPRRAVAPAVSEEVWRRAEEDGLVTLLSDSVVLEGQARPHLMAQRDARELAELRVDTAERLITHESPVAWLEALRLWGREARFEQMATALERRGQALLSAEDPARLWAILAHHDRPEIQRWRLRAGVEAGIHLAHELSEDPDAAWDPELAMARFRALRLAGRPLEAAALARTIVREASACGDRRTHASAAIMGARVLIDFDPEAARELLAGADPPDIDQQLDLSFTLASVRARRGVREGLRESIDRTEAAMRQHGLASDLVLLRSLAHARYEIGDVAGAYQCLLTLLKLGATSMPVVRLGDVSSAAVLSVERGELDVARELLAALMPMDPGMTSRWVVALRARCELALADGDLAACEADMRLAQASASIPSDREVVAWIEARVAERRGEPPPGTTAGTMEEALLGHRLWAARWGRVPGPEGAAATLSTLPWARDIGASWVESITAAQGGSEAELARALRLALEAEQSSDRRGLRLLRGELLRWCCDLFILLGRREAARSAAGLMESLAVEVDGAHLLAEARFYRAVTALEGIDLPALERLITAPAGSVGARRASALLGEPIALDPIDTLVLTALREELEHPIMTVGDAGEAWWIDLPGARVWWVGDAGAGEFSLARRVTKSRILTVLALNGGQATKEQLVRSVWGEVEYHPLRHDTRLQVTIFKLRQRLEPDPTSPTRLLTVEGGYQLGGRVRLRGLPCPTEVIARAEICPVTGQRVTASCLEAHGLELLAACPPAPEVGPAIRRVARSRDAL